MVGGGDLAATRFQRVARPSSFTMNEKYAEIKKETKVIHSSIGIMIEKNDEKQKKIIIIHHNHYKVT